MITLERETEKFANAKDREEIVDSTGRVLGYFMPKDDRVAYVRIDVPPFTDEDRRRAEADIRAGRVYTTAQVLEHLRSLDRS